MINKDEYTKNMLGQHKEMFEEHKEIGEAFKTILERQRILRNIETHVKVLHKYTEGLVKLEEYVCMASGLAIQVMRGKFSFISPSEWQNFAPLHEFIENTVIDDNYGLADEYLREYLNKDAVFGWIEQKLESWGLLDVLQCKITHPNTKSLGDIQRELSELCAVAYTSFKDQQNAQ